MVDASLRDATEFIRARCPEKVDAGLILGSGLGQLADQISAEAQFDYGQIPGFAATTAGGHRGQLLIGTLQGRRVAAMAGRFHAYEGHDRNKITFPVRVMRALGAGLMIVSNAAGGLRPTYQVGDIVIIRDHIDWIYGSPQSLSSGADPDALPSDHGVLNRLGAMYDLELSLRATESLTRQGHPAHQGTYLATLGPNYETRAEYRMMRRMGADLAGMSTVPEVIAAGRLGMRVLALSMVSNVANPDQAVIADHEEVLQAGRSAAGKMERIVRDVLRDEAAPCLPGTAI